MPDREACSPPLPSWGKEHHMTTNLSWLTLESRRRVLFFGTGFVVMYVRYLVQFDRSPWSDGLLVIVGYSLLHTVAVAFLCVPVAASWKWAQRVFLGRASADEPSFEEIWVFVCLTVLAVSLMMLFLKFHVPTEDADF
jgi:hypothetical protein